MSDDPLWYRQVKDAEAAELADRDAKEREAGTAAAKDLQVQLRQLLPEAIGVETHYQVTETLGGRALTRTIVPWAELRLADEVAVRIKARGSVWELWQVDLKLSWEVAGSPPPLIHKLARVLDDVLRARAEQEEGERRVMAIRLENEGRKAEVEEREARLRTRREVAVQRAIELGLGEEVAWPHSWVPWPEGNETDEDYMARVEEAFQEPLHELRREELGQKLRAAEAATFRSITLYEVRWPRSVNEEGCVDLGGAWSVRSEPDAEGFYPVLAFGQLRRKKIVVAAGAIEVTEHVFESFDAVPGDAKVWEQVEEGGVRVVVQRLARCLR